MSHTRSEAGLLMDEDRRRARLAVTMEMMAAADDVGEHVEPLPLRVGFGRETASIGVENGCVTLLLRDDDGNAVRVRMAWPSAKALGVALMVTGEAIETLP